MNAKAIFLVVLLCSGRLFAADYYVSSIHSGRSDSNSGTSSGAPWATFGKVRSMWSSLNPGDTVHLEKGSVWDVSFSSDYWYISNGGSSSGGHITLRGDDYGSGNKPVLRRTGGSGSSAFMLIQKSYVTLRDFTLDGGHSDYAKDTLGIAIGDNNADMSNAQVLNMTIKNLGGDSSKYICGIWVVTPPGYTVSDCLIEGNEVSDYSAHGLNHYSQGPMVNITWRNNIVRNSYSGGRYPSANSALQFTSGGGGCVFEYNYLEDTTTTEGVILGFGKYKDDTAFNKIRFNIIANSDQYGVLVTIDHSNKKLLYEMYGNLIYGNDRSGIAIHPYNSYAPGTIFNIYNNTFFDNYTDGSGSSTKGSVEFDNQANNTTINFKNNLICHNNYGSTVGLAVDDGFSGVFNHANNLYWHQGGTGKNIVTHGSTYTVAGVHSYESSAQNTDPLCSDTAQVPTMVSSSQGASPDGLKVLPSSPAVGAAINLGTSYANDIDSNNRSSSWTIGAYEINVAIPNPPTNLRILPSQ